MLGPRFWGPAVTSRCWLMQTSGYLVVAQLCLAQPCDFDCFPCGLLTFSAELITVTVTAAVPLYNIVQVTDEDVAAIEELGRQGGLFERLAASIAPEIFGMLDVKKVRTYIHDTDVVLASASAAPQSGGGVGCSPCPPFPGGQLCG